jgi:hypothetical protein
MGTGLVFQKYGSSGQIITVPARIRNIACDTVFAQSLYGTFVKKRGFGKNKNTGSQWDVREMIGKWNTIFNSLTLLTVSVMFA